MNLAYFSATRIFAGMLLIAATIGCSQAPEPAPNVVIITVDTLRADHMSSYGYHRSTTPNIDAWWSKGVIFDRATAMSSWTLPSMAMLFTGRATAGNSGVIPESLTTLAERLRSNGYQTAAVAANALLHPSHGKAFERGFETYSCVTKAPRQRGQPNRVVDPVESQPWTGDEVSRKAIELLDGFGERPFFLYLHYFDPHRPYDPPSGEIFADDDSGDSSASDRETTRSINLYDSEILATDHAVGLLLAALKSRGLTESTLTVLTADHGEGLWQRQIPKGEKGHPGKYPGHGIMLNSEQVHVPLMFRGPGVASGERRSDPVTLLDVLPTVLARTKSPIPAGVEGRDLLAAETEPIDEVYAVCSRSTTVTVGDRWRLHQPRDYRIEKFGTRPELFDLVEDPEELIPVDDPERLAELAEMVATWRASHAPRTVPEIGDEERQALRALGYTGEADRDRD